MIISKTPLRIAFFGGNTDFPEYYMKHGGVVISTTIDKFIYCIVVKQFDDLIMVNYSQKETVEKVDDLKHELVRESLKLLHIKGGIEITFLSDIPSSGSGLGSSASVTVGVLNALHAYKHESVSQEQLVREAIEIELNILKRPSGVQDQYNAVCGGFNIMDFQIGGNVRVQNIKINHTVIEDLNNSLMLLYTGVKRETKEVLSHLDIKKSIKQLDMNKDLALQAFGRLIAQDLTGFGKLLNTSWEYKKKLNKKTTNPHIDEIYSLAMKAGAIGGKVIGAGGGGFMLFMFPSNKRVQIKQALKHFQELPFRFEESGSKIIFNI